MSQDPLQSEDLATVTSEAESITESAVESALATEVATLKADLVSTQDRMLRIAADADNTRKRLEKEKQDVRIYAIFEFAKDMLPVIDAFERSIETLKTTTNTESQHMAQIADGLSMVTKLFYDMLQKHNVERIPGKGTPFNPNYHNAIARDVQPELTQDTVLEEFVAGFKIGDRVLRASLVKVGVPS